MKALAAETLAKRRLLEKQRALQRNHLVETGPFGDQLLVSQRCPAKKGLLLRRQLRELRLVSSLLRPQLRQHGLLPGDLGLELPVPFTHCRQLLLQRQQPGSLRCQALLLAAPIGRAMLQVARLWSAGGRRRAATFNTACP